MITDANSHSSSSTFNHERDIIEEPSLPAECLEVHHPRPGAKEMNTLAADRATDDCYFKPKHYNNKRLREYTILRVQSSDFVRWMTLVSMSVVEFILARDASQRSLHNFWLEHIEGSLKRELSRNLSPNDIQGRRSDLIQVSLLKTLIADSSKLYEILQSTTFMFLQVVYSDTTLWPGGSNFTSIPLSSVLAGETIELALFALMDCAWAMALGLPQQVEYDTTYYPRLNSLPPIQWAYGSPIEFQLVLADINTCRDKSPTAWDWRSIEQWLMAWQSRPEECNFADSWMTVAWYAVQESWRLSLLAYLHMAVCNTPSDDPRIQSWIKQILQVIGTVKKKGHTEPNVSFFVQYLIVGICARSEAHRQVARDKLLAPKGTKLWIMRAPDFVPVLDHLWHGATANGHPIRWSDYMRSRETMLPVI